ncbi:hypothetical protein RO3G_02200 [Rhizopus delemar RA 99-880]|uniref:Uncharacterized protein n=1 Tax=Rhizopus delemar (strain RA 99-880 / ATCC MYA-4621 / FGSC 9543 / NRRL 43880) TaxID=246409 RepID=I1BMR6_RHIO9|nr:hypothetical protein RO3G_02200 [Rhizopus delemar RA 99-880]|eukprot:EIE77496.1 hypothetical protein RO3G_02200 [Rhizopus delemar RA 99-880]
MISECLIDPWQSSAETEFPVSPILMTRLSRPVSGDLLTVILIFAQNSSIEFKKEEHDGRHITLYPLLSASSIIVLILWIGMLPSTE